jgi:hypothetical protein
MVFPDASGKLAMRIIISWMLIVGGALAAFAQSPPSTWEHNGSTVQLFANGVKRQFYYQDPRPAMQQEGVLAGTLLFDGQRTRNQYSGTAFIFSGACGAVGYPVSGQVSADDRHVTLNGNAPRLDAYCRVIGSRPDVLMFNLIALPEADAEIAAPNEKWICLQPVFTEEMRLKTTVDGTPTQTEFVANAIIYLRQKYCGTTKENLTADKTEHVAENCYQNSGLFRGERVYWGECYE